MSITTLSFAAFCISTILIYWRLPLRFRAWWLLAVSAGFVVTWSSELAGILLVVATVNYYLGLWLGAAESHQRTLLWTGIVFNIFVLAALKYSEFYIQAFIRQLARIGIGVGPGGLQLLVPIGLSFITLQMISYLVDIYRHQLTAEKNGLNLASMLSIFPNSYPGQLNALKFSSRSLTNIYL